MTDTGSSGRSRKRWCGPLLALVLGATPLLGGAQQQEQARAERSDSEAKMDPQAQRILRQMSDFLAAQREFSVRTEGTLDQVLDSGQKVQLQRAGSVKLQRPNRLRVDRAGDLARLHLFYDGQRLTLHGEDSNAYATTPAPSNVDAMLDMASLKLGLDAPAEDLLVSNPYAALTEDVKSGSYIGKSKVDGVPVHHLAFRNRDGVDWELWVEDGPRPLPRKYVITTRDMPGAPQYSVTLSEWNLSPRFTPEQFQFTPPRDAVRVSFLAPDSQGGEQQGGSK
ncbi:DUF2092 domain-containing protein [Corallococcus sp. AB049A]|uniref:DUF2092 domain-containing protein n=1 Tax=Corallococcus interemptor TaxID=2316720 RepID=A0A3A8QNT1_9BACT|nr:MULTISPECIES: DUF2092 domain-containing protein [Corallococcus]RKH50464.1 DUF2092 domain-containing protein [Corallococcus sp. AB050B]RKH70187.1 DUF2092 domain-containing protein [Corallococcus interemptor]RKI74004.1 DUF2092 domain-containing protein [Corallococcus sp. AB049A]